MPLSKRLPDREIREAGCSVKVTSSGHYLVLDSAENVIGAYAVSHGGRVKRGEVADVYVRQVRKALCGVGQ